MTEAWTPGKGIVLIVDDSPETLSMLIEALEDAGHMAIVAKDGRTALQLLSRVEPDVILLDAVMPGLDGFETCREIKAMPEFATTPIIFMTGLSDSEHVMRGLQAGGVDYVSKPFMPDELIARITVHIANANLIAEARRALDTQHNGVIAFRPSWSVSWASPRGMQLLSDAGINSEDISDQQLTEWLSRLEGQPISAVDAADLTSNNGTNLRAQFIGKSAQGDILTRIGLRTNGSAAEVLSSAFPISLREGEVLAWLANGKSNRDIAEILELSPRTVTKHVEQLFLKLGVENRTAAAAIALKHLFSADAL